MTSLIFGLLVHPHLLHIFADQVVSNHEMGIEVVLFFQQKFLKVEDDAEEDRLRLQDKVESLESIVRLFEIKMKNSQDHS